MRFHSPGFFVCFFAFVAATASATAFAGTPRPVPQPPGAVFNIGEHLAAPEIVPLVDETARPKGCAKAGTQEISGEGPQANPQSGACGAHGFCTGDCAGCGSTTQCCNLGYLNCPWCCCSGVACCNITY